MIQFLRFSLLIVIPAAFTACSTTAPSWRAGTSRAVITPEVDLWMAGYGNRDRPAEGKVHDLYIKVLALEDAAGQRAIVLGSDLLGIPRSTYVNVRRELEARHGLDPAHILLTSSHSHCGPVLRGTLRDVYPIDAEQRERIEQYTRQLESRMVDAVGRALSDLSPALVYAGQGHCGFAVNRRNNLEAEVPKLRDEIALKGPVDHAVPLLAIRDPSGDLRSTVFGYACHNTTLSFYRWCGDYAGFAQRAVETRHPGSTALFFSGCGADQNPLPRRSIALAESYGKRLAETVAEVLQQPMRQLSPRLECEMEFIPLDYGEAPTRERLAEYAAGNGYRQRWAKRLLVELDSGATLDRRYPDYPVQLWRLGREQLWVTLGGEVVVDYSLTLKKRYGEDVWIAGYSNDVMAYIPSLRVLREDIPPRASRRWGYEGNTSMMVYGLPAERWAEDVEERILDCVERLHRRLP